MQKDGSVLDMSGDKPYTKEKCTTDCLESGKPTKECHAHCKTGYKIYLASLAKGEGKREMHYGLFRVGEADKRMSRSL